MSRERLSKNKEVALNAAFLFAVGYLATEIFNLQLNTLADVQAAIPYILICELAGLYLKNKAKEIIGKKSKRNSEIKRVSFYRRRRKAKEQILRGVAYLSLFILILNVVENNSRYKPYTILKNIVAQELASLGTKFSVYAAESATTITVSDSLNSLNGFSESETPNIKPGDLNIEITNSDKEPVITNLVGSDSNNYIESDLKNPTKQEIIDYINIVFGKDAPDAIKLITECENRQMDPNAVNTSNANGSADYGLFQINDIHWGGYYFDGTPYGDFKRNWQENVRVAYDIFTRWGWGKWSCGPVMGLSN